MPKITVDMNEKEDFFVSDLGQLVMNEMAKSNDCKMLGALAECKYTSSEILADISKKVIASANAVIDNEGGCDVSALGMVVKITKNPNTDTHTLDEIYELAIKVTTTYISGTTPYNLAVDVLKNIAAHNNAREQTLYELIQKDTRYTQIIVKNKAISDKWMIELVEKSLYDSIKLAAIPELVRRLKEKLSN